MIISALQLQQFEKRIFGVQKVPKTGLSGHANGGWRGVERHYSGMSGEVNE